MQTTENEHDEKRWAARLTVAVGRRIKPSARGPVVGAGVGSAPPGNPDGAGWG